MHETVSGRERTVVYQNGQGALFCNLCVECLERAAVVREHTGKVPGRDYDHSVRPCSGNFFAEDHCLPCATSASSHDNGSVNEALCIKCLTGCADEDRTLATREDPLESLSFG